MIEVACVCGNKLKVQEEHAGLSIKCPKCRKLVAVAIPGSPPATGTLPPAGTSAEASIPETLPPPGLSAEALAFAMAARDSMPPQRGDNAASLDGLASAVERLTGVCRTIQILLASILGVLVIQILLAVFRK